MNDSTFPLVFSRALEVFNHLDQHSYIFPPGAKAGLRRLHHPFGTPRVLQAGATFCLLHHSDYLSGYSHDRFMPLWVSYTIQPVVRSSSCDSCGVLVRTVWEGLCFLEQLLSAPAALAFLCVWSALSADDLQERTRLWESVYSVYCHIRLCVCVCAVPCSEHLVVLERLLNVVSYVIHHMQYSLSFYFFYPFIRLCLLVSISSWSIRSFITH